MLNNKNITVNVTCLYILNVGKDSYGKLQTLYVFSDTVNRYIWSTAVGAKKPVFIEGEQYRIRCTIEKVLCTNEYKVQRVAKI